MSLEAAQAFRDKVNQSEELQEAVRAAITSGSAQELVALGGEHGHQFTAEEGAELLDFVSERGELSDFELEMVSAGGTSFSGQNSGAMGG